MKARVLVGQILTLFLVFQVSIANNVLPHRPMWLRAVANDPYTAKLSWQIPRDARPNDTRYRIGWKAGSNSKESYVVVNGTKGYHIFNNLHPYVYYYFRVQRGTVSGRYGYFSRSIWMETPETKPTAPPTNVSAYNTSSMGILVHWNVVPPQHRNGHILGFKVCYHKASQPSNTRLCLSVYALSIHIGGLEPYTPYYVSVLAYTNVGDGPGSPPLLVWTDEFVPSRAPVITVLITSTTTITVRWQPIPQQYVHGILRGYDLAYHEAANYGNKIVLRLNTTSTSYVIKNLKMNTMYGIRIAGLTKVRGFIRNGKISPIWNITTRPGCQAPTNVNAYTLCSQCMTVQWTKVPIINPQVIGYRVTLKAENSADVIKDVGSSKQKVDITGLKPYTKYVIMVAADTDGGYGDFSSPISQVTQEGVPSVAPKQVSVQSKGPYSILVKWSPLSSKDVNGVLMGYNVHYKKIVARNKRSDSAGVVQATNVSSPSVEIVGLKPFSLYRITVAAFTKKGNGPPSAPATLRTDEEVPSQAPNGVMAKTITAHSILVTWQPLQRQYTNGVLKGYHVHYRKKTAVSSVIKNVVTVNASILNVTIKGLDPNTPYEVWMEAFTAKGGGPSSNKVTTTTLKIVSGQISDVKVKVINPRTVMITWNSTLGDVTSYMVKWTQRGQPGVSAVDNQKIVKITGVYKRTTTVTGLLPYKMYTFTVREMAKGTWAPFSEAVDQIMPEDAPSAPMDLSVFKKDGPTLVLSWRKPEYTNGVIRKYVLYFADVKGVELWKDIVNDGLSETFIKHTFVLPEKTADYKITVQGFNSKPGKKSEVITVQHVANDDTVGFVQGQLSDVKVEVINPRTVMITWNSTLSDVTSYMVKWTQRGQPGVSAVDNQKIVKITGVYKRTTTVTGLLPYKMYTFTVREMAKGTWAPFSEAVDQIMPEDAPSAPMDLSVFKKDGPTLVLSWRKPEYTNGVIRKYVLYFADVKGVELWKDIVNDGLSETIIKHTFVLPEKTADYKITVQGFNSKPGKKSEVITVQHVANDDTVGFASKGNNRIKLPWLIFIISAIALFVLCIVVFILIRKSNKKAKNNQPEEEMIAMIPKSFGARRPIPVDDLKRHCDRYHAYDDALFIEEFKSLNHIPLRSTYEASQTSYNKNKNRYPNILPYDHSRVVLKTRKDSPQGFDYINASLIDGYGCPRKYIATQGPLKDTVNDFWRMVWENECTTIVMLGDIENTLKLRSDCEKYWPEHGHQEYGDLAVSIVDEIHMSDWSIRTFLVWSTDPDCMDKREVTQYQYTAWPDQGVPDSTASILIFQHKLRVGLPLDTGPIVVHCGAGVGRTGTFIAIDSLLDQRLMEGVVDVYGFVSQMRTQRNNMVQTEDQYSFIHDVLRDASICGITEIHSQEIGARLLVLCDHDPEVSRRRHDEFVNLPVYEPETFEHSVAYIRENIVKNRCPDVLPFDGNRVRISGLSNNPGTADYINASYIDGYCEGRAYVATQAPMENTVTEFWQMVWEQRCTAIVMLAGLTDKTGQEECVQYWPVQGCLRYGKYIVTKIDEEMLDDHTQRVLKLRCHGSMESLLVYHFEYHNWPKYGVPPRVNGLVCLHEQIQKIQLVEDHGPTIVHCSDGADRTGVYLTLAISIERLEAEDNIDVFQTVRWLRSQRPGMVGSAEQYNHCYQAVKSYLSWRTRATNDYVTA